MPKNRKKYCPGPQHNLYNCPSVMLAFVVNQMGFGTIKELKTGFVCAVEPRLVDV